jgi:uncharacterized membrane protein
MDPLKAMDCGICGALFLVAGIVISLRRSGGLTPVRRWCQIGFPFVAAPLAAFGMQHLLAARLLVEIVPPWMPARLFWVYFVGFALLAAALSFTFQRALSLSAPLVALLFFIFAMLIDLPGAVGDPRQWLGWSMMLRELTYLACGLAVASFVCVPASSRRGRHLFAVARWIIAPAVLYFAVEQLRFPQYTPGVPDLVLSPAWVPVPKLLTFITGLVLLISGALLLVRRYIALGAAIGGAWLAFLTFAIYVPTMVTEFGTAKAIDGVDFVFDTLLYGGTLLLLATARLRALGERK